MFPFPGVFKVSYSEFLFFNDFLLLFSDPLRLLVPFRELMIRPFLFGESDFNILLPGDVVVPKCPHSELLLEFTTLRPVRPGVVHWSIRAGYLAC